MLSSSFRSLLGNSKSVSRALTRLSLQTRRYSEKAVTAEVIAAPSFAKTLQNYASLSKAKLGSLVAVTTIAGYAVAPGDFIWQDFIVTTVGTVLSICSANALNQILEVAHDSRMTRTQFRVLPTGALSTPQAAVFAITVGVLGPGLLCGLVNEVSAGLAAGNILLYAFVYTPLKRLHPINTWVGAVVGAIPPLIGWSAKTGSLDPGAWGMAALLYFWQMPHFMALSWNLKNDYHLGGYKMLSTVRPEKVAPVALRNSLYLWPLGLFFTMADVTSPSFMLTSMIPIGAMTAHSYIFLRNQTLQNSKKLFKTTLWALPAYLLLLGLHKKSQ